jgi:hypothetical protein
MKFAGAISFDWRGERKHAVTSDDVLVELRDEWVAVSTLGRGTAIVAWEWVRELSGWSPIALEDRP